MMILEEAVVVVVVVAGAHERFPKIPLYASSCAQHSLNKILFEK